MLSSVNSTLVQQAYQDFLELNGKKTSEMNEYQLRLIDFFTKRYSSADRSCIRKMASHPLCFLAFHGAIELSQTKSVANFDFIAYEDKEVAFPIVRIHNSRFAMDVAFKSIFEPEYQPLRYYKCTDSSKEFNRIRHVNSKGYYMCKVTKYMGDEPEFWEGTMRVEIPSVMSEVLEVDLPIILKEGKLLGDVMLYKDKEIIVDTLILPYTTEYSHASSQAVIAGILVTWSKLAVEAPQWVQQALAHSDEAFEKYIAYLGMTLGEFNRAEKKTSRATSNSSVKAISVGLNGFKPFITVKPTRSTKRRPLNKDLDPNAPEGPPTGATDL